MFSFLGRIRGASEGVAALSSTKVVVPNRGAQKKSTPVALASPESLKDAFVDDLGQESRDSSVVAQLRRDVAGLTCVGARHRSDPEAVAQAASYIERRFAQTGSQVIRQPTTEPFDNIIASFGPREGKRLVFGAHYDTVRRTPGADDNASGVAILLALADRLGRSPPPRRIDLVAFAPEEEPLAFGSGVHAASLRREGVQVVGMISLECLGFFRDAAQSQRYPVGWLERIYGNKGNYAVMLGRFKDLRFGRRVLGRLNGIDEPRVRVRALFAPRRLFPDIGRSDNLGYWRNGYPAVMLTDTAEYRNPNYHGTSDRADTLDYARMGRLVEQLEAAAMATRL